MATLSGPTRGPLAGGAPRQLVVICHGLGADGKDLIGLAPPLRHALPHAALAAPTGPEHNDMGPHGRQWFSLRNFDPPVLLAGARRGAAALNAYIDAELARLNVTEYALAGFSQGAMMSLFTGLRREPGPRAILAFSGALIGPETLPAEIKAKPPVLLAHGEADPTVPTFRSREAASVLRALGVPVETMFTPGLEHEIGGEGLAAGIAMLRRVFE